MQYFLPDLIIENCIPNCEHCPSAWTNKNIGHKIVCRCKKCGHGIQGKNGLEAPLHSTTSRIIERLPMLARSVCDNHVLVNENIVTTNGQNPKEKVRKPDQDLPNTDQTDIHKSTYSRNDEGADLVNV